MDISVATMIDKDLKGCAASSAKSACECTTPELRQMFTAMAQDNIRRQAKLATMMSQKGWYVAPQVDQATVDMMMPQLQAATQGMGMNAGVGGTTPTGNVTAPRMV